jgi:hypothetical protein
MTKGDIVENIIFIDVKDKGILHISNINITILYMSKIKITRWIFLKVLILDF